jgi:hypothetical protein
MPPDEQARRDRAAARPRARREVPRSPAKSAAIMPPDEQARRKGVLYAEADLRRTAMEAIVDEAVEFVRTFGPDGFGVETNEFQELFVADMNRAARAAGVVLPTYGLNNTVNKDVRIRRLGPYLSQRLFRFNPPPGAVPVATAVPLQRLFRFKAAAGPAGAVLPHDEARGIAAAPGARLADVLEPFLAACP